MNFASYFVQTLLNKNVNKAFGIPGAVLLSFLDAAKKSDEFETLLSPNENSAGFSAIGAASVQKFGVCFITKGPGFTNSITPLTSAFLDSVPVLFLTSHQAEYQLRGTVKQELDLESIAKTVTKKVIIINDITKAAEQLEHAIDLLTDQRPGPVLISVLQSVWDEEVAEGEVRFQTSPSFSQPNSQELLVSKTVEFITNSEKPVLLLGNGVLQTKSEEFFRSFAKSLGIPVLTSRQALSLQSELKAIDGVNLAAGFIGSNGTRAGNLILELSDSVISIGNKLGFSKNSKSFGNFFENRKLLQIEIDRVETERVSKTTPAANLTVLELDLNSFNYVKFSRAELEVSVKFSEWRRTADALNKQLNDYDENSVEKILKLIYSGVKPATVSSDIGMNERWTANALFRSERECEDLPEGELVKPTRLLYSQWLGAVASSIPSAVGASIASSKKSIAVVGDYGMHFLLSELGYLSERNLPVLVIILNNSCMRGMKSIQETRFGESVITANASGMPSFNYKKLAEGFGLDFERVHLDEFEKVNEFIKRFNSFAKTDSPKSFVLEIMIDPNLLSNPVLKAGAELRKMQPEPTVELKNRIEVILKNGEC